jgi:hypothetical protein
MIFRTLVSATLLLGAVCVDLSHAEDFSVIDPTTSPGKARFMAVAQKKFDQDHEGLFQTTRPKPKPEDEQPLFECGMKAILADVPDADAMRLANMVEGKEKVDPSLAKWFSFDRKKSPERHKQVIERAKQICPQYSNILR